MNKRHLYILATILVLIGTGVTLVRIFVLEFPLTPRETVETWRIETRVQFDGTGNPARVELQLPQSVPGLTIINQSFVAGGFGQATRSPDENRQAIFTTRKAEGRQVIYHRAVIRRSRSREFPAAEQEPPLKRSGYRDAELAAARAIVKEIEDASADNRSFQNLVVRRLINAPDGGEESLLLGTNRSSVKVAEAAVRIMALANIPARAVHGLTLVPDRRDAQFTHWTEVFEDGKWIPFDPVKGINQAPENTIPWWRGDRPFVSVRGGTQIKSDVAVSRTFIFSLGATLTQQKSMNSRLIDFSVFGLPIQTQEVFRILFVLPIGVLLLALLRNVIGVKTIGTFLPVLISLAFRDTGLIWGITLFAIVVICGLAVRAYMEQLKLLMVPRLATVATVVIIVMAILSVVSFRLGLDRGLSVSIFPIVILTMAIERLTTTWEERGGKEAGMQALGTLVVSVLAFWVMNINEVQHFMFVFPESLLIVLAAMILLGRYSGYRLVELPRFRVLAGPKS